MIDVSGDRDTPKRLSDRIITISGQAGGLMCLHLLQLYQSQADQKERACLGIVQCSERMIHDLHACGLLPDIKAT